jgi:membrane-bound inhibitor of C-type lysozyme
MHRTSRFALAAFGSLAASLAVPQIASAEAINAVFNCDGGLTLNVVFDNDADPETAIVTIEGEDPMTLPIAMSGSGYNYSDGKISLSGKGDEAMWEVDGKDPVNCKSAE